MHSILIYILILTVDEHSSCKQWGGSCCLRHVTFPMHMSYKGHELTRPSWIKVSLCGKNIYNLINLFISENEFFAFCNVDIMSSLK